MSQLYSNIDGNYNIVLQYFAAGLSVIPVKTDGSKAPVYSDYLKPRRRYIVQGDFASLGRPRGIAFLTGEHSGNLESLDFDRHADKVFPIFERRTTGIIEKLPLVASPGGGYHLHYRCPEIGDTGVIAELRSGKKRTIIEVKGRGGKIIVPGSHPATHPTGKPYRLIRGNLFDIPVITPEQRNTLLEVAALFDQREADEPDEPDDCGQGGYAGNERTRPGDIFAARTTWDEILEPHDWQQGRTRGDTTYWRKPDTYKDTHATSTGNCFYAFSTNAPPFKPNTPYTKFAAHAALNHKGDYRRAAAALNDLGSVSQTEIDQVNQLFN